MSVVLVDVRPRTDYEAGHVPGAVHLDPETDLSAIGPDPADGGRHPLPDDAQLERVFGRAGIGPSDFVLALDDGSGWAARCWWLLRHVGHDAAGTIDVRGYVGPLSTEIVEPAPDHVPRRDRARTTRSPPRRSSRGSAIRRCCSSTRAAASAGSATRSRSTRSPGGFPAPPTLPSPSRSPPGRRTRAELVAYCGSGVTACVVAQRLVLAGRDDVRLYPGSFSEWCRRESYPIEKGTP